MPSLSSPLLNHNLAANVTTNNYDPSSYASAAIESSAKATAIRRGCSSGGGTAGTASVSATTMMQNNEICSGTTDINLMSRKRTTYDINDTGILLLPGTTSNMILIERFLFWQIIWNKLHALGWILETQGNQLRDDFYFFPPHAIKTTTISDDGRNGSSRRSLSSNLKPNIDFFDDELRIMHCLITDSRYTLLEPKISMICNEYKEYLFQLKVLQGLKSSEDDASRIHINHMFPHSIYTPNKQMMDYIQNRVQIRLLSLSNATNVGGHSPSSITRGTSSTNTGAIASSSALSYSKTMRLTMKREAIEKEAANSMRMKIKMNANANANSNNNVHNNYADSNRPQQNHQMLSRQHPRHHNYNNINNATVLQNHHYHLLQQQQQLHQQQQQQHNEQQQRLLLQEIARRSRITTTTTPTPTASDNRDMTAAAMGTTHIASSITALTRNDRDAKVYAKAKAKSDNGGNDKASRTARITNDDIRKLDVLCDDASFISKKPPIIENIESAAIDNDNNNSHNNNDNNNKSDNEKNLLLSKNCGNIIYLELIGDTIEEYCTYEQDAKERTEICLELVRNVTSNCGRFLARKEVGSGSGNSGEKGTTTNKNNQVVEEDDDDDDDETNNNNTNNSGDTESLWYELEEEQAVFITKLDLEELEITKDVTSNNANKKKKTPPTASSPALSATNENNISKGNRTIPPPPPPEAASTATNADAGYGKLKRRISSVSSMSSTPSSYSTTSKTKRTSSCGSPTLSSSSDYATAVARISSSCGNSGSESVRAKYIRQKAVKDVKMEERRRKPLLKRNLMTKCIPTLSRFPLDESTVNEDRAAADVPEFNTLRNFSSHTGIPVGNGDDGIIHPPADDEPTSYNTSSTACSENEKAIDKKQKPSSVDEKLDAYYSKHPNKNKHVRFCVMCGERRQCNRSSSEYRKGDIFIPNQNRGVCSWCDTNVVWNVITPAPPATTNESTISMATTTPTISVDGTTLELKWCKGCKNFRCWTAFCNNGMATKCDPCREKQSLKYLQKVYTKDLEGAERTGKNIIAMNSMNTNHMNYNHIP